MTIYTDYILTPKIIKSILLKEHHTWYQFHENNLYEYMVYALDLVTKQINALETYKDIERFINQSRRMTLKEWIETL